jgi:psiF repeat
MPAPAQHPAGTAQATSRATTKPQSAASIECSKQADAKNLHGKARKQFRSSCKKQMTKKS